MIKVAKFGGTSLASADEFRLVAAILKDGDIKVTVASAGGKKGSNGKITDLLLSAYGRIVSGDDLTVALKDFYNRITELIYGLKVNSDIEDLRKTIECGFKKEPTLDFLLSRGEYVYSLVLSEYLGKKFVDAAEIMKFDEDGKFNLEISKFLIRRTYSENGEFITGGFYGSLPDGKIKVFERGGSDYTGAVIAAALGAEYENYTDVNGMYSFDPHIISSARRIDEISFEQARIMSEFGAGVIHPDSVLPLIGTDLPIHIKNTFEPLCGGTVLREKCEKEVFGCAIGQNFTYAKLIGINRGDKIFGELNDLNLVVSSVSKDGVIAIFKGDADRIKNLRYADKFIVCPQVYLLYLTVGKHSEKVADKIKSEIYTRYFCLNDSGYFIAFDSENKSSVIEILKANM